MHTSFPGLVYVISRTCIQTSIEMDCGEVVLTLSMYNSEGTLLATPSVKHSLKNFIWQHFLNSFSPDCSHTWNFHAHAISGLLLIGSIKLPINSSFSHRLLPSTPIYFKSHPSIFKSPSHFVIFLSRVVVNPSIKVTRCYDYTGSLIIGMITSLHKKIF